MKKGVQPDKVRIKALAEEETKKFEDAHAVLFENVYNACTSAIVLLNLTLKLFAHLMFCDLDSDDSNKDGSLDQKECKLLMAESLKAQKGYIPTQVEFLLECRSFAVV